MKKNNYGALTSLTLFGSILLLASCQKSQSSLNPKQEIDIDLLNARIDQIERVLQEKVTKKGLSNSNQKNNNSSLNGPIKSITFRIGTKDDRLRIYWANGMNSDLPCTKEQAIWVCG